MASVVIIDDEPKVRREISQYLKEMGVEEIIEFSSSTEFEKTYFLSLAKKPEAKAEASTKNPLAHQPPEIIKYLNAAPFSKDAPTSEKTTELEITPDQTQITKMNVAKIFGRTVTEIVSQNVNLQSLLAEEFKPALKKLLADVTAGKADATQLIAVKNDKGEIWLFETHGRTQGKNIVLKMTDLTREIAHQLGKEMPELQVKEEKKKPLDVIIFRNTCIQNKDLKTWVTKTATLLKKAGLWPEQNRPKFVALRYEDDPKEKAEFNHPFIDDLLCFPLDRLIFLQKMELTLALPKKASPSFLFVQEATDEIEISKKVLLERICDLGFAMANPIPLAAGTPGHFYFRFPGQKPLLDVYGKVLTSIPHPDRDNEHLVYFNFFGLSKSANKEVKAFLQRDTGYKNLIDNDPNNFLYNPDSIFLTEAQKQRKTVALIDFDENVIRSSVDYLKKEIGHIDIAAEDTYSGFFKKYLDKRPELAKATPAKPEDIYGDMVSFLIGTADLNLQMCLTPPTETDKILGHDAQKLFSEPQNWMNLLNADGRTLLMECLHLAQNTRRVNKNFELVSADNTLRTVLVELILEENGQVCRINLKLPDTKQQQKIGQLAQIESLDCLIIDYALLPDDLDAFLNGLRDATQKAGIKAPADGPRVIVTATETQKVNFEKLLKSRVFGFLYKPLEIRRLLYLVATGGECPFTIYNFENIGWKHDHIPAKIARSAHLTEMSEFGATIRSEQPLKPGTMLYLFKSIFQNAPDQNLCVRVYASEEDSSNDGQYLNSVVYFGITDAFLKFTRSYIRETYAQKKAQEGQSGG